MSVDILYAILFSVIMGIAGILIFNELPIVTAFLKSFSLGVLVYILLSVSGTLTNYSNISCGHEKYTKIL